MASLKNLTGGQDISGNHQKVVVGCSEPAQFLVDLPIIFRLFKFLRIDCL